MDLILSFFSIIINRLLINSELDELCLPHITARHACLIRSRVAMPPSTPFPNKSTGFSGKICSLSVIVAIIAGIVLTALFAVKPELMTSSAFHGRLRIQAIDDLDGWTINDLLEVEFSVSGNSGPYQWSVSEGNLPPQTSLSTNSSSTQPRFQNNRAKISGTLNQSGTYGFTLLVKDSKNNSRSENFSIKVGTTPSQAQEQPQGALAEINTHPDDLFISKYPNKPIIRHLGDSNNIEVGVDQTFVFVVTNILKTSPTGKPYPRPQCNTNVYVSWGEDDSDPVRVPAICSENGNISVIPPQVKVHHTFTKGGKKIIRAWETNPAGFVKLIPEGQFIANVKGNPIDPVSCNDELKVSTESASSSGNVINSGSFEILVGEFDLKFENNGWISNIWVTLAGQSNLFYWTEDLRRITLKDSQDNLLGRHLFPYDPEFDATSAGGYYNPLDSNASVNSTENPVAYFTVPINITPLEAPASQTKRVKVYANFNSRAAHNNMWKFGLSGFRCYGGPNLIKNTFGKTYLSPIDLRFRPLLGNAIKYGGLFTIKNLVYSGPFQFRQYNKGVCEFGKRCEHMIPANSGVRTFQR